MVKAALMIGLLVAVAVAEGIVTDGAIEVRVGQTVTREVGWAMGYVCDDPTLFDAEMRNKDPDTNVFVVTGRKVGTTLCRVGTHHIEDRPTFLFEVSVVAAPKPAPKPAAPRAAR